ncbi:MAG: glycyl-radical enzyme activating protein [Candidatus Omnitrophota bacterium]
MSRGTIFDIQDYAINDGPGIRTLVFLKGCPLACRWCCNPESQSPKPTLMHSDWRCTGCGTCSRVCPTGAVTMATDGPRFNRTCCEECPTWDCLDACLQEAISKAGASMTAESVVGRVAKNIPFYVNSGGGVTFSGGEPYSQFPFLMDLLRGCRNLGIHTAIETCGFTISEHLIVSEPWVDLFLFDLKIMDSQRHLELTGVYNGIIMENLTWLAAHVPQKVIVRLPLIPGCTDDWENVKAIGARMNELGIRAINLEPFNPMGIGKYHHAGKAYRGPVESDALDAHHVDEVHSFFSALGFHCELL